MVQQGVFLAPFPTRHPLMTLDCSQMAKSVPTGVIHTVLLGRFSSVRVVEVLCVQARLSRVMKYGPPDIVCMQATVVRVDGPPMWSLYHNTAMVVLLVANGMSHNSLHHPIGTTMATLVV